MVFNVLSKPFQLFNKFKIKIKCTHYSSQQIKQPTNIAPIFLHNKIFLSNLINKHILKSKCTDLEYTIQRSIVPLNNIIECPTISNLVMDIPLKNNIKQIDIIPNKIIEIPNSSNVFEKQAARLVIIRRKKMKKHKKKKFLKRMKTLLQKREIKKQQLRQNRFEVELKAMSLEAEKFDPKKYVEERIDLLTRHRLPNKWRGEVLPEDMIKKFIDEKEKKQEYKRKIHLHRLKVK